jgi:hypothetical protein
MKNSGRPQEGEYATYYKKYIDLASEDDVVSALDAQAQETAALLQGLSEEQAASRYAPDKWSIKQLVGHVTDGERVFNSAADERSISDLAAELAAVRRANVMMLRALPEEAWHRVGTASDNPISVRALAYIILGHERHHMGIVRERYL